MAVTELVPAYYHVFKLPKVKARFPFEKLPYWQGSGHKKKVSGQTQRGKIEAYLCMLQESSNYRMCEQA